MISSDPLTKAGLEAYTNAVVNSPPTWIYNCVTDCNHQIAPKDTVTLVEATSATPLFTPKDLYPTRTTGSAGHLMGWVRIDAVTPVDGPFASFDVGGTHYDLKLDANGAVTKNVDVWISGVVNVAKEWVNIAVVLDPTNGSYIRVANSNGPVEISIPTLTLDSSTDVAKLGGTGTTSIKVAPM